MDVDVEEDFVMRKKIPSLDGSDEDDNKGDTSSDEMSDDDSKLEEEACSLEKKVEENPYDYSSYVELITLLKKLGELTRLRQAREKMSKNFPLTPELWLSWLQDEIKLATSDEERKAVYALFERAVHDYLSVEVWLEYAQFSIGDMGSEGGIEKVCSIFDRALTATGLHVARGAIIWEAYREFENVLCAQKIALNPTQDKSLIYDRVLKLFKRQLSVPLLDMQNTYAEFQNWITEIGEEIDTKNIEHGYKKALNKLSLILPFEEQLLSCPTDRRTACYRQYIAHEWSTESDPARLQSLYERAIAEETTPDASFWLEYIEYLNNMLKIESVLLAACKRAVRNCPWSSALWQHYLRILEHTESPHEEVKAVLEAALGSSFPTADDYRDVWISYIDYLRRRVDFSSTDDADKVEELILCLNRATDYMTEYFGVEGDPNCVILQYWARIEAIHRKNMSQFRLLWNKILGQGHDKMAAMWLEYALIERCYSTDGKHLRRLYARALKSVQDWPESIGNAWLNFERDVGTLGHYDVCLAQFKERMKDVTAQREKLAKETGDDGSYGSRRNEEQGNRNRERGNRNQDRGNRNQERGNRNQERGNRNQERGGGRDERQGKDNLKRKRDEEGKWSSNAPHTEYVKKTEIKMEEDAEAPRPPKVAPPPGYKPSTVESSLKKVKIEDNTMDVDSASGPVVHDSSKDLRTVFLSNLDFSVTEDEIRERFVGVGTLTDLRLVKDFKGRSKGFGYVEFSSASEAAAAIAKDREPINGRPMYISKCDPDKQTRQPVFRYSSNLEKNKLFIKGLPKSMTRDELTEMYKPFGALKEVRLVTFRNGHSRGLAYVEFEDATSAGKAVLQTDEMTISDHVISVAISKPPDRKFQNASLIPSLGGGGDKEIGGRGRVKMASSLVPRSVQISQNAATSASTSGANDSNGQSANGGDKGDGEAKKAMSNQDFRQMLLGKK